MRAHTQTDVDERFTPAIVVNVSNKIFNWFHDTVTGGWRSVCVQHFFLIFYGSSASKSSNSKSRDWRICRSLSDCRTHTHTHTQRHSQWTWTRLLLRAIITQNRRTHGSAGAQLGRTAWVSSSSPPPSLSRVQPPGTHALSVPHPLRHVVPGCTHTRPHSDALGIWSVVVVSLTASCSADSVGQ